MTFNDFWANKYFVVKPLNGICQFLRPLKFFVPFNPVTDLADILRGYYFRVQDSNVTEEKQFSRKRSSCWKYPVFSSSIRFKD